MNDPRCAGCGMIASYSSNRGNYFCKKCVPNAKSRGVHLFPLDKKEAKKTVKLVRPKPGVVSKAKPEKE